MGCCFATNRVSDVPAQIVRVGEQEEQTDEWKSLVDRLISNEKLTAYTRSKKRTNFKNVKDVADFLSKCPGANSKVEKAWLVYVWVSENIAYDVDAYKTGVYGKCDSQSVLERGKGVCQGYSEIFQDICVQMEVECVSIVGFSKGLGHRAGSKLVEEDHAWNAIPCGRDGYFRYIDSTWGAGYLTSDLKFVKKFEPYYFAVPAHIFSETHYSTSIGNPGVSLEDFERQAKNTLEFHRLGLTCVSGVQSIISATKNPLVIEYISKQKLDIVAKLYNENGPEIKNTCFIQKEFSSSSSQFNKYCLLVTMPDQENKFLVKLFGLNIDLKPPDDSFIELTSYKIVRESFQTERNLPRYNLSFNYGIQLKSHHSPLIYFGENPLLMEFSVPQSIRINLQLFSRDDVEIKNAVWAQKSISDSNVNVKVAIPEQNKPYFLRLNVVKSFDEDSETFFPVAHFRLVRTKSDENDKLIFCGVYHHAGGERVIYSPIEMNLLSKQTYKFRYFIDRAIKVALVDSGNKWTFLKNDGFGVWELEHSCSAIGPLKVFALFRQNENYEGVCYYHILD